MRPATRFARRVAANLSRAPRALWARGALRRRDGVWLVARLAAPLPDLTPPRLPFARPPRAGLLELLTCLDAAAADPGIAGVVVRVSGPVGGFSRALSLRRALDRVRESGKPVVAWGEQLDTGALLAVGGAAKLWLPASGSLLLVGVRLESFFLRGLLDRLAVKPHVVRVGSYKTAGEHFTRESLSPEAREQLEALADDLFEELLSAMARGRGLERDALRKLVDDGPYTGAQAADAGLCDGCLYPDEVERQLGVLAPASRLEGDPERVRMLDASVYFALRAGDVGWHPWLRDFPRIAYVVGRGAIHRGRGPRGIAAEGLREVLEELRRERGVHGVVLRLESPGGDGVASELLWRSVSRLAREKPVVVSMGDVVASGGYYMAAASDAIVAEAGTVTGSIGVVGGKVDVEGLYGRIGLAKDAVERGAHAGILSETRGFTPGERARMREAMGALYGSFVQRVAEGRGLSTEAVEAAAGGRLWSGARAQGLGLVDELGGPLEALALARRRAGLSPEEPAALEIHPRLPTFPELRSLVRWLPGRPGFA
jgi:protease-4